MPIANLDPVCVADALRTAFAMTPDKRDALGAASRQCYEANLTLEAFAAGHLALYDAAAETRSQTPIRP